MTLRADISESYSADPSSGVIAALLLEASETLAIDRAAAKLLAARAVEMLDGPAETVLPHVLAPWQAKRVDAYIDEHIGESITVVQLASCARLSASYFGRAFKASFGDPPHAYVLRKRVALARKLMVETSASLAEIALDCGMADQSHLTRIFRRFTGMSPNAWRRSVGAGRCAFELALPIEFTPRETDLDADFNGEMRQSSARAGLGSGRRTGAVQSLVVSDNNRPAVYS